MDCISPRGHKELGKHGRMNTNTILWFKSLDKVEHTEETLTFLLFWEGAGLGY